MEKTTPSSIEAAVAILYSANGLNQPGNTVISGHNYRNGSFFGNNDKLKLGDKVYITDNSGTKLKYNIYSNIIVSEMRMLFSLISETRKI